MTPGFRTVAVGLAAVLFSFTIGLVVLVGGSGGTDGGILVGESCALAGPVPGLGTEQAANAGVIVAVADALGAGDWGAQVALMTSLTESGLRNDPPGVGGGGSVGLFQQIASDGWGTVAEEEDPALAAAMFVTRMLAVPGWSTLPPWQLAQAVQRSGAGAESDGVANYGPNWAPAGVLLAAIGGWARTVGTCGESGPGAVPAGPAGRFGLPAGYTIPPSATPAETVAVSYALAQLGKGYAWGAAGPALFDCSGLTMMAWAQVGVTIAHYTGSQLHEGTAVASGDLSPGDLVLVPGGDGTLAAPGHVGLYLGDGLVESAVDPQQGIIVQSWANFTAAGVAGIRHLG